MSTPQPAVITRREEPDGPLILQLSGPVGLGGLARFSGELRQAVTGSPPAVTLDLAQVTSLDSAGALDLLLFRDELTEQGLLVTLINLSPGADNIIRLVNRLPAAPVPLSPRSPGFIRQIGEISIALFDDFLLLMTFFGELLFALGRSCRHPARVRWGDVLFFMKRAGVDGLPIVALISFLLGLIMAFMSSLQLKQFGAEMYVASLVGLALVKELGPMMTAILVAGRSGSAFAAEIGTMKVNEEVNALVTMGFDPISFLAVPKVLATVVMVPLLTIYADLCGITGGLIVGIVGLDLTAYTYVQQTLKSFTVFDVISSLVKSVCFALIIAGIGCQRGFRVSGGAEGVGTATTSSVVTSLFLIIVTDSAFAVVLHYLG